MLYLSASLRCAPAHRAGVASLAGVLTRCCSSPHDLVRAALWRLESGQADDPERAPAASRAARVLSLETAERLVGMRTRRAGRWQATLLLAEILTNVGRSAEAVGLTQALPPDSLSAADREALVYCTAIEGLHVGDPGGAADIVGGVQPGCLPPVTSSAACTPPCSPSTPGWDEALDVAGPLVDDAGVVASEDIRRGRRDRRRVLAGPHPADRHHGRRDRAAGRDRSRRGPLGPCPAWSCWLSAR